MNDLLKFSWLHVFAYIAAIFIGYVSFMGKTYQTDGNFLVAGLWTGIIVVVLLFIFIGAQQLKGTDRRFKRRLTIERVLVFVSPIVFVLLMFPFLHFWTVFSRNDEISTKFERAVRSSESMFDAYDTYAKQRVSQYDEALRPFAMWQEGDDLSIDPVFELDTEDDRIRRDSHVATLKTMLHSSNDSTLRQMAVEWIHGVRGVSVWNIFVLGNLNEVKEALGQWRSRLVALTEHRMQDEPATAVSFDADQTVLTRCLYDLNQLSGLYTRSGGPTTLGLLMLLLCYVLMLAPYLLQRRFSKSRAAGNGLFRFNNEPSGITLAHEQADHQKQSGQQPDSSAGAASETSDATSEFDKVFGGGAFKMRK